MSWLSKLWRRETLLTEVLIDQVARHLWNVARTQGIDVPRCDALAEAVRDYLRGKLH
jgi:hypothetical protein